MKNDKTVAPYLELEDERMERLRGEDHPEIMRSRENGDLTYKELYSMALHQLAMFTIGLLPTLRGHLINQNFIEKTMKNAYSTLATVFRGDLLAALKCDNKECKCHQIYYNLLHFERLQFSLEQIAEFDGIHLPPDRVECNEDEFQEFSQALHPPMDDVLHNLLVQMFGEEEEVEPEKIEA